MSMTGNNKTFENTSHQITSSNKRKTPQNKKEMSP